MYPQNDQSFSTSVFEPINAWIMVAHKVVVQNNSDIKYNLDYEINLQLKKREYHKGTEYVSLYRDIIINGCYEV
jgi:hypothetical protein